jgi:peptidoglycan/LPS O-acetylase OafA/YrhL
VIAAPQDVSAVSVAVHIPLAQGLWPAQARALYPIAWTLGVEALFYVLVPVIAVGLRRSYRRGIDAPTFKKLWALMVLGSVVLTIIAAAYFPPNDSFTASGGWAEVMNFGLPGCLVYFVPGMVVAYLECKRTSLELGGIYGWLRKRPVLVLLVAVLLWFLAISIAGSLAPPGLGEGVGQALIAAASGLILLAALSIKSSGIVANALAFVGTISYGLYLWHYILLHGFLRAHGPLELWTNSPSGQLVAAAALFAVTLPVAVASWYLLERPLLRRATAWARSRG